MLKTIIFASPKREEGISGGSAKWRGNHPLTLSKAVFEWLRPKIIADPMCGSGTTGGLLPGKWGLPVGKVVNAKAPAFVAAEPVPV